MTVAAPVRVKLHKWWYNEAQVIAASPVTYKRWYQRERDGGGGRDGCTIILQEMVRTAVIRDDITRHIKGYN